MTEALRSAEAYRLSGLYFWYFAFVGIVSPFLSLYLAAYEFSVAQIGVLLSLPQWMRVVSPGFWGWLADSGGRPDLLLRISSLLTLASVVLLPVAVASGFWVTFALLLVLFFASGAQMPIGESRTLALTQGDAGAYGRIRVWGSIGFIVAVALVGLALDAFGLATLPGWIVLALLGLLAAVWPMRVIVAERSARLSAGVVGLGRRLREPHIAMFFLANGLMIFAHAAYYVLFSLFLDGQGFSATEIGFLWTLGVIAEVALFRWQQPLFERFSLLGLLGFSMAVAAVRFTMIGMSVGSLAIILLAQLLHAITFGLHHSAVMKLLHAWFDTSQQARAQALYITIAYGIGGAAGGLVVSGLWTHVSPPAAFFGAAVAAGLGAMAVVGCARLAPGRGSVAYSLAPAPPDE